MKHGLIIDLDVLVDTRLGTLAKLKPELISGLDFKQWETRKYEDPIHLLDGIDSEEFFEAYENRDKETLQNSVLTNFIVEFADILANLKVDISLDVSKIKETKVYLNFYPYQLTKEEQLAYLACVYSYVGDEITILPAYFEPKQLTLPYFRSNEIYTYIVYDLKRWMSTIISEEMGKEVIIPVPELTVVTPEILKDTQALSKLTDEDRRLLGNQSPFEIMRLYWAPFFRLTFYPIWAMSVLNTSMMPN